MQTLLNRRSVICFKVFSGSPILPRYMIVVTDGVDNSSPIQHAARLAKSKNITVIAVGVGRDQMMMETLKKIANGEQKHVFEVNTFIELKAVIPEKICTAVEKGSPRIKNCQFSHYCKMWSRENCR